MVNYKQKHMYKYNKHSHQKPLSISLSNIWKKSMILNVPVLY